MAIVLLSGDLMVISRVGVVGTRQGVEFQATASPQQAVDACRRLSARLLIVDLSMPAVDIADLLAATRAICPMAPATLAFGPHVHESRLAAAREAGCDRVVSRGEFFGRLDALLQL